MHRSAPIILYYLGEICRVLVIKLIKKSNLDCWLLNDLYLIRFSSQRVHTLYNVDSKLYLRVISFCLNKRSIHLHNSFSIFISNWAKAFFDIYRIRAYLPSREIPKPSILLAKVGYRRFCNNHRHTAHCPRQSRIFLYDKLYRRGSF